MSDYNNISLVVAYPNKNTRRNLWDVLQSSGFKNIRQLESVEQLRSEITMSMPDLIICASYFDDDDIYGFIHDIRHHLLGENPFVPIMVIALDPDVNEVKKVLRSGADDLVVLPLSTTIIQQRVKFLVNMRKPFVVSSNYIGPARPVDFEGMEKTSKPIDVPNVLYDKIVKGIANRQDIQKSIDDALKLINTSKLENYFGDLGGMVKRAIIFSQQKGMEAQVDYMLEQIRMMISDTMNRLIGSKYSHVFGLCASMEKVLESMLKQGAKKSDKDWKLLPQLSDAIYKGFKEGTEETAKAIAKEVSTKKGS